MPKATEVPPNFDGIVVGVDRCPAHGAHTVLEIFKGGELTARAVLDSKTAEDTAEDLRSAADVERNEIARWAIIHRN